MINIFDPSLPLPYAICFLIMAFILGAVIGSFLNVVIIRLPLKEPITGVHNRSHCMSCGHTLNALDLFPIFSYIFLGGKCRYCKAEISPRYWIVELVTALCFTASVAVLGISYSLGLAFVLAASLIVASGIDVDRMEIPTQCVVVTGILGAIELVISVVTGNMPWYDHLIGAVCVAVPFALLMMVNAMGGGDVMLMAAAGFLLGWKHALLAAAIGIVLGAVGGGIELLSVPKGTKRRASAAAERVANEWYDSQTEKGIFVTEGKSDVIYGSIFKGKSDIEKECLELKHWNIAPDIDALNEMLNKELSDISKFGISFVIDNTKDKSSNPEEGSEHGRITNVTCKRQVVFGPYLSVGIFAAYLVGDQILQWYFQGVLHI